MFRIHYKSFDDRVFRFNESTSDEAVVVTNSFPCKGSSSDKTPILIYEEINLILQSVNSEIFILIIMECGSLTYLKTGRVIPISNQEKNIKQLIIDYRNNHTTESLFL